ncbi:hypothetical protein CB1_002703001 [Camelus ferus]|nr:hypothetical protein CB1_002703001 [Camelus ferus]
MRCLRRAGTPRLCLGHCAGEASTERMETLRFLPQRLEDQEARRSGSTCEVTARKPEKPGEPHLNVVLRSDTNHCSSLHFLTFLTYSRPKSVLLV